MSIIHFIRNHKNLSKDLLITAIKENNPTFTTKSQTKVLFDLFEKNYSTLNRRQLSEFLKWSNEVFKKYEPTSSVEQTMTKIRSLVKRKYDYNSPEYKSSLRYLVFNKDQKEKNIEKYNKQVNYNLKHSEDIPISLINKIFKDNETNESNNEMLTYLLLNSGCRFAELYDSKFSSLNDEQITQSHIAKTIDKTREISKTLLDKNSKKFMHVLETYRSLQKNRIQAIASLNIYLNEKYKFSSYNCRKYFCNLSYELDSDKKEQKQSFLAHVLGHSSLDISKIYSAFNVVFDEDITFRP